MTRRLPLLGLAFILIGCKASSPAESDSADDGAHKTVLVAFQGKPDPALAGTWVADGGGSVYELHKDGKLQMTALSRTPGSKEPQKRVRTGLWGVTGTTFYTKTTDSSGDTVAKYDFEKKGNSLDLSIRAMKMKIVFHRQ